MNSISHDAKFRYFMIQHVGMSGVATHPGNTTSAGHISAPGKAASTQVWNRRCAIRGSITVFPTVMPKMSRRAAAICAGAIPA